MSKYIIQSKDFEEKRRILIKEAIGTKKALQKDRDVELQKATRRAGDVVKFTDAQYHKTCKEIDKQTQKVRIQVEQEHEMKIEGAREIKKRFVDQVEQKLLEHTQALDEHLKQAFVGVDAELQSSMDVLNATDKNGKTL